MNFNSSVSFSNDTPTIMSSKATRCIMQTEVQITELLYRIYSNLSSFSLLVALPESISSTPGPADTQTRSEALHLVSESLANFVALVTGSFLLASSKFCSSEPSRRTTQTANSFICTQICEQICQILISTLEFQSSGFFSQCFTALYCSSQCSSV